MKKTAVPLVKEGDERSPLETIPKDSAHRHTFNVIWRQFRPRTALKKHRYGRRDLRPTYTHISAPLPPARTSKWMELTLAPPPRISTSHAAGMM